jgi:hypothetical protein
MKNSLTIVGLLAAVGSAAPSYADINDLWVEDQNKAWSKYDPFEQWAVLANDNRNFTNPAYFADAFGDKLSALGRAGYISRCMLTDMPALWAMCQGDIELFDAAKANAEIDADTAHPRAHESAKGVIAGMKARIDEHAAKVKALFDSDDAYKKLFDIAADARKKSWGSPELRAVVMDMDDARTTQSRKALAGCEDKVWPLWVKAISAIPAKSFSMVYKDTSNEIQEAHAATVLGTPDGYLAAVALISCLPNDAVVYHLTQALHFWPGFRGPRNAALTTMIGAGLQLDKKDAQIAWPNVDRRRFFTGNDNGAQPPSGDSRGGVAPIVSLKPNGDKVHVTFGPVKTKMTKCMDYKPGKHLSRIEADGRLVYEGTCYKYAQVMVTQDPPKPADVPKRYATGMKPGMYVDFSESALFNAKANVSAKQPSVVFGVPVK